MDARDVPRKTLTTRPTFAEVLALEARRIYGGEHLRAHQLAEVAIERLGDVAKARQRGLVLAVDPVMNGRAGHAQPPG